MLRVIRTRTNQAVLNSVLHHLQHPWEIDGYSDQGNFENLRDYGFTRDHQLLTGSRLYPGELLYSTEGEVDPLNTACSDAQVTFSRLSIWDGTIHRADGGDRCSTSADYSLYLQLNYELTYGDGTDVKSSLNWAAHTLASCYMLSKVEQTRLNKLLLSFGSK
jgi:hypothetical protein